MPRGEKEPLPMSFPATLFAKENDCDTLRNSMEAEGISIEYIVKEDLHQPTLFWRHKGTSSESVPGMTYIGTGATRVGNLTPGVHDTLQVGPIEDFITVASAIREAVERQRKIFHASSQSDSPDSE